MRNLVLLHLFSFPSPRIVRLFESKTTTSLQVVLTSPERPGPPQTNSHKIILDVLVKQRRLLTDAPQKESSSFTTGSVQSALGHAPKIEFARRSHTACLKKQWWKAVQERRQKSLFLPYSPRQLH